MLSKKFRLLNLLDLGCGSNQRFREMTGRQFADATPNSKRFDSISPEELIAKEWFNNGGNPS